MALPATRDSYYVALNRTYWPKHWQAVIEKIDIRHDQHTLEKVIVVLPANPAYRKWFYDDRMQSPMPEQRTLPPIEFSSFSDLNNWAILCARLDN